MSTLLGTILADFNTSLATDIAVGGTTATLSSATDDDGVSLPAGRYFFTIDGSNSSKEHISCDLSGSSLTNIKTVTRQGVESTGVARKHRIGATVTITDFGHIKYMNDLISGATTFNSSAPLGYDGAPASLTGNQFATVSYVLATVSGGTVVFDQQLISNQTSGEALAINDFVYYKEADAKWYKVDADTTTTYEGLQTGFNKTTAAGADITIQVAISGPVSGFSGLTAGSKYYASTTAGAITDTAPTNSMFAGWALTTTTFLFNPNQKTIPTQKEKDAMVGSTGIPSTTNKFITQDNTSISSTDQTQTTSDGTSTVGEADTTGLRNLLAQSFIPAKTKIRGVKLYKAADTGTFTGTVTVTLEADNAGSPSGTPLATKTITNAIWTGTVTGEIEAIFDSEYTSLTVGNLYWIVVDTSTSDTSNHPNLGINIAGGYASGSVKYKNTTDGWVAVSTVDLYFKTLEGNSSQVVKTDSDGDIPSGFYDISKMPTICHEQNIPMEGAFVPGSNFAIGSSPTGDAIYILYSTTDLYRYQRDSLTGYYVLSHNINPTISLPSGDTGSIIQIGVYIYVFSNDGTNIICRRFLAADLTGETVMTVPTVPCTSIVTAWTDGTSAYVVSASSDTTSRKWTLSGTTFTADSTATVTTNIFANASTSTMFDGTSAYVMRYTSGTLTIEKLNIITGTSRTTTTKTMGILSAIEGTSVIANIDTNRCYVGFLYGTYDAAAQNATRLYLVPITKP